MVLSSVEWNNHINEDNNNSIKRDIRRVQSSDRGHHHHKCMCDSISILVCFFFFVNHLSRRSLSVFSCFRFNRNVVSNVQERVHLYLLNVIESSN